MTTFNNILPNNIDSDHRIQQAINEIYENFGDRVSVNAKAKSLVKFGENQAMSTAGSTVMDLPSGETEETFISTNGITHVVSSSSSDTMDIVLQEGHTVSGSDYTFAKDVTPLTLTGQTPVALPTSYARFNRARINAKANGTISFYEGGAVTSGVPDDPTEVHCIITAGKTQTQKGQTTISSNDYYLVSGFTGTVLEKSGTYWCDFNLEIKSCSESYWIPITQNIGVTNSSGTILLKYDEFLIVPKNHDVRLFGNASATLFGAGGFSGYLASIIG